MPPSVTTDRRSEATRYGPEWAAGKGSRVTVETEGGDADAALAAVLKLIAERFGEPE